MDALTITYVVVGTLAVLGVVALAVRNSRHAPSITLKGGPGVGGQAESGMGGGVPLPELPTAPRHRRDGG